MKQVVQNLKNGRTEVVEVPWPAVARTELLIRTTRTLVSAGTERMLVDFGKANLLEKARQQPDKVKQVLEKARTDGVLPTISAVRNKLDQPLPLGYCNVGVVIEAGRDAVGFAAGDRVASNGKHAEIVSVPANLCAKVPANVADDDASFTVIGAIALEAIRLVQPTLGEAVVVTGLGLVGLMTVQLLKANGCRVLGIDHNAARLRLAAQLGAEVVNAGNGNDVVGAATAFSRGRGVDAVIIAAATDSNAPVEDAARMCRKRGRIVLVGVAGLELSRADFYSKELSFQVSCSYGPGRYDSSYEQKGFDYPVGYVRWTEQRNFEAVLDMMADRRLDVSPLISHKAPIANAEAAYELLSDRDALGILLEYPERDPAESANPRVSTVRLDRSTRSVSARSTSGSRAVVGFIGAGNYASAVLGPAFRDTGARLKTIVSQSGLTGFYVGTKLGFEQTTTDPLTIFDDPEVTTVVVATRHDSHAAYVIEGLQAGKHVFVEKPLATTLSQVDAIDHAVFEARGKYAPVLMAGFNRRFAPHIVRMKQLLTAVNEPIAITMTVNAGAVPADHWTQDVSIGGRIVGEACHFIDLLRFLAGSPIVDRDVASLATKSRLGPRDSASVTLRFENGSIGSLMYLANGHKSLSKERLEVFAAGRVLHLDNFRKLTGYGWPGFSSMRLLRQDKGQRDAARAFISAVTAGGQPPIPVPELLEVSRIAIDIAESMQT
ncbi:MAG: bi-domain-containing oxidoreductase [Gemmatimonadaceae bacterium]